VFNYSLKDERDVKLNKQLSERPCNQKNLVVTGGVLLISSNGNDTRKEPQSA
jgi:hypothetical protein